MSNDPPPQYVSIQYAQRHNRVDHKREYSPKHINAVKWLTMTQLIFGVVILVLHIVTTSLDSVVQHRVDTLKNTYSTTLFFGYISADSGATGVWVGLLIILTAGVGIGGYRKQKRCLIVAHLVLNVLLLLCYIPLAATLFVTISGISDCRRDGISYYRTSSFTSSADATFFGEDTPYIAFGSVYCKNALFRVWVAFDSMILASTAIELLITLAAIVYNGIAVCVCCRQYSCCGSCGYETSASRDHTVTYSSQPRYAVGAPGVSGVPGVLVNEPGIAMAKPAGAHGPSVSLPPYSYASGQNGNNMIGSSANEILPEGDLPPAYSEVVQDYQQ